MSLKEHPDYREETKRLKETIDYIESTLILTEASRRDLRSDTHEAYVELDPLDSSMSYSRILINAKFSEILERQFDGLLRSQKKPYFCRIDFQPEGSSQTSKLYIGKMSLEKDVDAEPLIVDWRAPVASVYYDGRLGEVTYSTPAGAAGGTLHKKRQYTINDGCLEDIMDVDITTTDAFLQAALGESKDNRLKDIVSTIQAEQNEIIRADILYPLIVQGAAGSGKTTIALHRIAYLIYTYEETFEPENFLIIAPNKLFLNYISEVLPELGAHHVKQATFAGLVYDLTGIKLKLVPTDEKLKAFIGQSSAQEDEKLSLLQQASKLKGSLDYCAAIDDYVAGIESAFLPKQHFKLEGYTIYKASAIRKMFLEDYAFLPLYQRLPEIKKILALKLKRDKKTIVKEIENYVDKKINEIRMTKKPSEKRRLHLIKLMQLRDEKVATVKKSARTLVNKYMALFPMRSVTDYFKDFAANQKRLMQDEKYNVDENLAEFLHQHNADLIAKNRIEFEDLATILYLKHKLFGFEKKEQIKCIVVDEAQDFSSFQIHVLKEVFRTELFTLLGDIAQGIHSYRGTSDWAELGAVFTQRESRFLALEQSYRTTIEIMNAANEVLALSKIPGLVPAKPVVRHGEAPSVKRCVDKVAWVQALEERLGALKAQYQTIAVICKTEEECNKVEKLLNKRGKLCVNRLREEDEGYESGVVLLPSHLAKGLEFDAVVVAVLEDDFVERELDIKLFYVAMTRALHSLDIVCLGSRLRFLEKTSLDKG